MDDDGEGGPNSPNAISGTSIVCKFKAGTRVATRGDVDRGARGGGSALNCGGLALYGISLCCVVELALSREGFPGGCFCGGGGFIPGASSCCRGGGRGCFTDDRGFSPGALCCCRGGGGCGIALSRGGGGGSSISLCWLVAGGDGGVGLT